MAMLMCIGITKVNATYEVNYVDVQKNSWYEYKLRYVTEYGLIQGTSLRGYEFFFYKTGEIYLGQSPILLPENSTYVLIGTGFNSIEKYSSEKDYTQKKGKLIFNEGAMLLAEYSRAINFTFDIVMVNDY